MTVRMFGRHVWRWASWIPVAVVVNQCVVSLAIVNGPSMYPTLNADKDATLRRDIVVCWKLWSAERLRQGDIVMFRSPNNPESLAIKRITADEGSLVPTRHPYPTAWAPVPPGHVWVEGDNAAQSLDSNAYGPISKRLIEGRVLCILYPFHRWRLFSSP